MDQSWSTTDEMTPNSDPNRIADRMSSKQCSDPNRISSSTPKQE